MDQIRNRAALASALAIALASGSAAAEPRIASISVMEDLDTFVVLGEDLQFSIARSRITLGDVGDITRHCMRSRAPDGLVLLTCTLPGGLPPAGDYTLTIEHFAPMPSVIDYGLTIGAVGPQGPTGERGPAGERGQTGPQGTAGAKGDAGPKGDAGEQGPQGLPGAAGPAGPEGAPGPKGDTGAAGPAGPKGDTGEAGPAGPVGPRGDTGAIGPAGPKGDAGPQGAPGLKGDVGPAGPVGPKGDTGAAGPKGDTGAPGAAGPKGDTGPAGPMGPMGQTGPMGPVGPMGPAGPAGASGTSSMRFVSTTATLAARTLHRGIGQCAVDEVAVAGGMYIANHGSDAFDFDNVDGVYVNTSGPGRTAREWVVVSSNVRLFGGSQNVTFWIGCAGDGAGAAAGKASSGVGGGWRFDGKALAD